MHRYVKRSPLRYAFARACSEQFAEGAPELLAALRRMRAVNGLVSDEDCRLVGSAVWELVRTKTGHQFLLAWGFVGAEPDKPRKPSKKKAKPCS